MSKRNNQLGFFNSSKLRNEFTDYDYLEKLGIKELQWLRKFHREVVNADFKHKAPIYKATKKRRQIYNENNSRNRDTYAIARATKKLYRCTEVSSKLNKCTNNLEETLIELLDSHFVTPDFNN